MLTAGVTVKAGKNRPLDCPLETELAAVQLKLVRIMTVMRFLQKRQGQVCPDQATPHQSQTHSWILL